MLVTLDVLEAEIRLLNPRIPVIRGMLANLEAYPELKEFRLRLIGYYNIKILNKIVKTPCLHKEFFLKTIYYFETILQHPKLL